MGTERSDEPFGAAPTEIPLRAVFDAANAEDPDAAHVLEVGIPSGSCLRASHRHSLSTPEPVPAR